MILKSKIEGGFTVNEQGMMLGCVLDLSVSGDSLPLYPSSV